MASNNLNDFELVFEKLKILEIKINNVLSLMPKKTFSEVVSTEKTQNRNYKRDICYYFNTNGCKFSEEDCTRRHDTAGKCFYGKKCTYSQCMYDH